MAHRADPERPHAVLGCYTSRIACNFYMLLQKLDRRTSKELEAEPESLKNGDYTLVLVISTKPLLVETITEYPPLGWFTVRDMKQMVAVGVNKAVTSKQVADETSRI